MIEPNTRAEVHKALSACISKLQSTPANLLDAQRVDGSGLAECVEDLSASIASGEADNLAEKVKKLNLILSSLQ